MKILITGGAGFIGSAMVRFLIEQTQNQVLNLDKLTYAGNLISLEKIGANPRYKFVHGDVCNYKLVSEQFAKYQPDVVMHLAAETHVDRSIDSPNEFIQTNITGTAVMLECARQYWNFKSTNRHFFFHHISTDEVYGSLSETGFFTEDSAYDPSSPYSASKASSDHLVRAWHRTYGLPVLITNCSNNYGPRQNPEKFIPLMILNALEGKSLPLYGNGEQVRDWLHVDDHVRALYKVVTEGKIGETYNIGGHNNKTNLEVVNIICSLLDEARPIRPNGIASYRDLITHVADRPGHDQRYAIDADKIKKDLRWVPEHSFETGLRETIDWYLKNTEWCNVIKYSNQERQRRGLTSNDIGAVE